MKHRLLKEVIERLFILLLQILKLPTELIMMALFPHLIISPSLLSVITALYTSSSRRILKLDRTIMLDIANFTFLSKIRKLDQYISQLCLQLYILILGVLYFSHLHRSTPMSDESLEERIRNTLTTPVSHMPQSHPT